MRSILQTERECFFCHTTQGLNLHHVIHGTANRKIADATGLTVFLCYRCHAKVHDTDREMDLMLIQYAQRKYEETHTREEFRELFGKSWL